eukprot:scaffold2714_cov123-Isochrysis_galbana.AAC.15
MTRVARCGGGGAAAVVRSLRAVRRRAAHVPRAQVGLEGKKKGAHLVCDFIRAPTPTRSWRRGPRTTDFFDIRYRSLSSITSRDLNLKPPISRNLQNGSRISVHHHHHFPVFEAGQIQIRVHFAGLGRDI